MVAVKTLAKIGLAAALAMAGTSAFAQGDGPLGNFRDWSAFAQGAGAARTCYIGSVPKKEEGKYTRRGDVRAWVAIRPAEKVAGEVSLEAGYPYKDGRDAEVTIDGKAFRLFTQGENAWAYDAKGDRALVAAMKAGRDMVVEGTSRRGTLTTDTYSLSGFTAAYNAAAKACRAR